MKTMDIIGVFSNADVTKKTNEIPVLYKIIELGIVNNFQINRIVLYNGFNDENYFKKSYNTILKSLKNNYKDYDFTNIGEENYINDIDELKKINNGIILYTNKNVKLEQIQISDYYKFFLRAINMSKADSIYYNMQSGNVHSKEALQICCQYFSRKENYIYFESFNNKNSIHKHNKEIYDLCNKSGIDEIVKLEGFSNLINRISIKEDMYKTNRIFHDYLIMNYLENKKYFEMYYHYINYKNIFKDECSDKINHCFKEKDTIKYQNTKVEYRIEKKDVANYYLNRLYFIKFKIEEKYFDRILYRNIEELIFALYHLESCDYVDRKDDYYSITIEKLDNDISYVDCLYCYHYYRPKNVSNGSKLPQIELNGIDSNLIKDFNELYKQERHDNDGDSMPKQKIQNLVDQLIKKFDNEYIKYLNEENCSSFNDIYCGLKKYFKDNIKVDEDKLEKLSTKKISNNVCFLCMCGSTDPINSRNDNDFYLSSFLTFKYGVENYDQLNDKDMLKQLHDINKLNKIPSYFIMSYESIIDLFDNRNNENYIDINQMDSIYKGTINIIPFAKNNNDKPLNYEKIINNDYKYKLEELLNLKSYSSEGYTLETCVTFIKQIVSILLQKYDDIVLVESSGVPNIKMALSFMNLMYPTRIIPYMVKDPYLSDSYKTIDVNENYIIKSSNKIGNPVKSKVNILNDICESNENYNHLISYLIQDIKYKDEPSLFASINEEDRRKIIEHDDLDVNFDEIRRTARILCKSLYLSKFGFDTDYIQCLDRVFEVIFGQRLGQFIGNKRTPKNIIEFELKDKYKNIYVIYENCDKTISKDINKSSRPYKTSRPYGILNAIEYAVMYASNKKDDLIKGIEWINDTWEIISASKHNGKSCDLKDFEKKLNIVVSFDDDIKRQFESELQYYQNIEKKFPQLGFLNK